MDRIIEKKKWTLRRIGLIAGISFFILFLAWLILMKTNKTRLYVDKDEIAFSTVEYSEFQEFIPVDGIVYPKTTIYIDAIQGGTVEKVFVEDGAMLRKGDPILKLLNDDMALRYMDQETRMYDAINNLQNSKFSIERTKLTQQKEIAQLQSEISRVTSEYDRKKQLFQQKLISTKEYEDAERDYNITIKQLQLSLQLQKLDSVSATEQIRQIGSSIQRMHNNLQLLNQNLENLYIKSPADGQLSSFNVEIGQTKSAGEHLGQIDVQDGIKLKANVDERYVGRVQLGQKADVEVDNKKYDLEVRKIYTDVTGGSFQVDLFFTDQIPENVKRGQTFQVRLQFSSPEKALVISRGGFFQETGGNWIYVLTPDRSKAVKTNIRLGRQNTGYYEVLEGLKEGDLVVISSYDGYGNKDELILR